MILLLDQRFIKRSFINQRGRLSHYCEKENLSWRKWSSNLLCLQDQHSSIKQREFILSFDKDSEKPMLRIGLSNNHILVHQSSAFFCAYQMKFYAHFSNLWSTGIVESSYIIRPGRISGDSSSIETNWFPWNWIPNGSVLKQSSRN